MIDDAAAASAWAAFGAAPTQGQFLAGWLAILCGQVEGVVGALLLLTGERENTFAPAAVWPDQWFDAAHLAPVAQQALTARRGLVLPATGTTGEGGAYVAYPLEVDGVLRGAIVLDAAPRSDDALRAALRQVHWGAAWLSDLFRQQVVAERDATIERLALANAVVAAALQQPGYRAAALAAVDELATRLGCSRVSLGLDDDGHTQLQALSHTALFDARGDLPQALIDAMDETLDLDVPVVHPPPPDTGLPGAAHAALARQAGLVAAMSVPLVAQGRPVGALCFERQQGEPFDERAQRTAAAVGEFLGPVLVLRRDDERGLARRALQAGRAQFARLFGPGHAGVKLVASVVVMVVVVLSLVDGRHRVTAKTVVEGATQRATVAPFDGFVAESFVRAGDTVKAGQPMARLDDRELRTERTRWAAEAEQVDRRLRQAQAQRDRAAMNVLSAQAAQAQAQLAMVDERLERIVLRAPVDGVVISGDLRQLLGTPVTLGKVLFETAPLDSFRVVLQVDERDIAAVAAGQPGDLVLAGLPGEPLRFAVAQVTPVATAEDGRNFFRVEARMEGGVARLRPGMEGVGKIDAGERRLVWIWTHRLVDWLRVSLWAWLP